MLDYFLKKARNLAGLDLNFLKGRLKGVGTKKLYILGILTLVVTARLFFSVQLDQKAWAKEATKENEVDLAGFDPMEKIRTDDDIKGEKVCAEVMKEQKPEVIVAKEEKKKDISGNKKIKDILSGYPMEKMVEAISQKDKETAAFLVAIAKKESDWGKHAPTKGGRDCYNYWGYKGGYNPVQGYSCFDSPEQAVEVVGGRIDKLTDQGLTTPERMVVWKCGSSCSWDRPEAVRSWIGAVRTYWSKLVS